MTILIKVTVRQLPLAATSTVEGIDVPQQLPGTHWEEKDSQIAEPNTEKPDAEEESAVGDEQLEESAQVAEPPIMMEGTGSLMEDNTQFIEYPAVKDCVGVAGYAAVRGPGPVIAANWTVPGLTSPTPPHNCAVGANDLVLDVNSIEDPIQLSVDEKKKMQLWSIGQICEAKLPKLQNMHLQNTQSAFSKEDPTVLLDELHRYPLPPLSLVHALEGCAEKEVRDGQQSIILPTDEVARFPLKSIGAWRVIHEVNTVKSLWGQPKNGLLWATGRLPAGDIDRLLDLMDDVPWDGKAETLYGEVPFSSLSVLLSDSSMNDKVVDAMMSLLLVRMREQRLSHGSFFGIAHTSFAQSLLQLQEGFRNRYPANAHSLLAQAGNLFEQKVEIKLYGVANSQNMHWVAFCIAKTSSKIVVTWADSLNWNIPDGYHNGLKLWLAHHCPNLPVEVDTNMMTHGVQDDNFSCGVVAINTLKHHLLGKEVWVQEHKHTLRLAEFKSIVEYCLVSQRRTLSRIYG